MGAHSKAQLILEDILNTSEFFRRHACMKEANEINGGVVMDARGRGERC